MRTGGCFVQHTLSAEAAAVVKQAVSLARRRTHAQVTPLHVAITLLMSGSFNLLRKACLQSHSHPLQYRALELCFNVALNRLPTITSSSPMVSGHGMLQGPTLSNALVAAFKRAQANQRRCCLEQQQHNPQAAQQQSHQSQQQGVKVDMEQLIISILDDPSVSRVMREAGFSSSSLKQNLEEALQGHELVVGGGFVKPNVIQAKPLSWRNPPAVASQNQTRHCCDSTDVSGGCRAQETDVVSVVESLVSKRKSRNTVVVGECQTVAESVVKETVLRLKSGRVPEELRSVEFLNPQLSGLWFRVLDRYQLEEKLFDLNRAVVSSACEGRGAILYLGDLKWALDGLAMVQESPLNPNSYSFSNSYYCPVRHAIMELGRMVSRHSESRRLWVLATATYQTFINLRKTQPWVEALWGFHPVTVPALSLSLEATSASSEEAQRSGSTQNQNQRTNEFLIEKSSCMDYSAESKMKQPWSTSNPNAEIETSLEKTCREIHWGSEPQEPPQRNRAEDDDNKLNISLAFPLSLSPQPPVITCNFLSKETREQPEDSDKAGGVPNEEIVTVLSADTGPTSHRQDKGVQFHSVSRKNSFDCFENSSSASSLEIADTSSDAFSKLCNDLQRRVANHCELIPGIASAVLMSTKKKRASWLLFLGSDEAGKLNMASGLARFFFGSESKLVRCRPTSLQSHLDVFWRFLIDDPSRVVFFEDFHRSDLQTISAILNCMRNGILLHRNERRVVSETIVVLSIQKMAEMGKVKARERSSICRWKRKAESKEEERSSSQESLLSLKRMKSRISSSSSSFDLDLNASADSQEDGSSSSQNEDFSTLLSTIQTLADISATFFRV